MDGPTLAQRQHLTGDAIILERAIGVLERRFGPDVSPVPETRANLCNAALALRREALYGLPPEEAAIRA